MTDLLDVVAKILGVVAALAAIVGPAVLVAYRLRVLEGKVDTVVSDNKTQRDSDRKEIDSRIQELREKHDELQREVSADRLATEKVVSTIAIVANDVAWIRKEIEKKGR